MNNSCILLGDRNFGPAVGCGKFDFSLTFEQSIFGVGISSLLLLSFPFRLWGLYGATIKTRRNLIYPCKIIIATIIVGLQAALLALWTKHPVTRVAIAANVLALVGALAIVALIIVEHNRIPRPAKLTSIYLLSTIVADFVLLRSLYYRDFASNIAAVLAATASCKLVLLCVESWPKTSYLKPTERPFGPVDVAGPLSKAFMWWLNPILILGNRQILDLEDLDPLDQDLYSEDLRDRMSACWEKYKHKESYPMLFAGGYCLRRSLLVTIPPRAAMIAISYAQTFLITDAINYLETPSQLRNVNHAYGLIAAAALIYVGNAILNANYLYKVFRMITLFRGATASLIYSRALTASADHKQLQAVTLMSTDVDRIAFSLIQVTELWAQVTQIALGIWLLWRQLGATAIAPTLLAALCFILQSHLSKKTGPSQADWVKAVQRRVGVTSTVLRSMKSVKLAGLATSMGDLLQAERGRELKKAVKFRWILVLTNAVSSLPTMAAPLVVFAAYAIEAKIRHTAPLSTAQAFTSLSILALLTTPAMMLLMSVPQVAAATGCIKRIQKFLLAKGYDDQRLVLAGVEQHQLSEKKMLEKSSQASRSSTDSMDGVLAVTDLVVGPTEDKVESTTAVSFTAQRGSVTMILGPVGSGKSTLLRAILGEISPKSGSVSINTSLVGYCSQTPWLQNRSIRDNIIGPANFDRDWYRTIVRVCALEEDFAQMPEKDCSIIGSRGITLSGGQKHRVALARALYSRCSILVLDDFMSSIDRKTQRLIAHNLFSKDGHVYRHGCALLVATHITTFVHHADTVVVLEENGSLAYSGPPSKWLSSNNDVAMGQDKESPETPTRKFEPKDFEGDALVNNSTKEIDPETIKRQKGDMGVWLYYGKSIGWFVLLITAFSIAINVFCNNFQKLWLQWNTGKEPAIGLFLGIYTMFVVIAFVCQFVMFGLVFLVITPKSAIRLHEVLVKATVRAPISFFETTDSSILLNRFSQDMSLIDFQLPLGAFMIFLQLANCIMAIILISLGSTYMASTIPLAVLALFWIQKYYLRTSRQIRLLDLEAKTPLYQHFTETLEGVATVRAFGWQIPFDRLAISRLDDSQRPYFLLYCIQRWLALVLGLLVAAIAVILVALALCVPNKSSAGSLGVALTSILAFNQALTMLVTSWTNAETSLGSVARTESFEKHTPSEVEPEDPVEPDASWPDGNVEVSDLGFVYSDGTVALKGVTFSIPAGAKFGVCGRTGSGKSTLLSSFLRLIDPSSGSIVVDGIDLSLVCRNTVRDRLICLPQDALVFPGSFKFNLDPENRIPDVPAMTAVLKSVRLWTLVEGRGGLDTDLMPESLSHGEQQLLALARAILRKKVAKGKCILVLDEATSNLDEASEVIVQNVIKEEFAENTVITVAHRLDTIKEADQVLMLEGGRVVKVGTPKEVWGLMGVGGEKEKEEDGVNVI